MIETTKQKIVIPLTEPAYFNEKEVPIKPYLLGVLLGDGSLTKAGSVEFTKDKRDQEIIDKVIEDLPDDVALKTRKKSNCHCLMAKKRNNKRHSLTIGLNNLGLLPIKCEDRFKIGRASCRERV